ncbi:GNAT family N-acetyltransferase [Parafrigoribacterium soli]|uniref:GNAT family N-acetyltransferase n=1 Tax=Parafrigoribacterium soli TaxID=3144663 RepID=UPI0032EED412
MATIKYPVIEGDRLRLRPPVPTDAALLLAILLEPEVSKWWCGYTAERVRTEMIDVDDHLVIEIDGRPAGMVAIYENNEPEYRATAMHIFLGAEWYRKRYGAEALATAIIFLAERGHHRFTLDPNANNEPAIRSYERLGFRRVGVARDYQRMPNGELNDALLMDLVMRDFPSGRVDWR